MCTKWFSDGDVHKYFNPYGSPYEAYINYMNVLADLRQRLEQGLTPGLIFAVPSDDKVSKTIVDTKKEKRKVKVTKDKSNAKKAGKKERKSLWKK
jgi:alpha-amylase